MQHTLAKGSKKERKLQLEVVFPAVIGLLLSSQLLKGLVYCKGCFTSPISVLCFALSLKMNL